MLILTVVKMHLLFSLFPVLKKTEVRVLRSGAQISLGINAPLEMEILKEELVELIQESHLERPP